MKIDNLIQNNNILANLNSNQTTNQTDNNNDTGLSFVDTLKNKLDEVNDQQIEADKVTQAFIEGDNVDVHQVMISSAEAQQSLDLAVQVRNKLVEAFQEINRMQL